MDLWKELAQAAKTKARGYDDPSELPAYTAFEEATKRWGPMGGDWGLEIKIVEGGSQYKESSMLTAEYIFFYPLAGTRAEIAGVITKFKDENGGKALATAAVVKAMSYLGWNLAAYKRGQDSDGREVASEEVYLYLKDILQRGGCLEDFKSFLDKYKVNASKLRGVL